MGILLYIDQHEEEITLDSMLLNPATRDPLSSPALYPLFKFTRKSSHIPISY